MMRMVGLTLLAGAIAFVADMAIATVALRWTRVPPGFPPFTVLPVASGAFGGAILAALVYGLIRATAHNPDRVFFFVSLAAFALALLLPLRLSFTRSPRFAGATPAAQMVLVVMHAVVAATAVTVLTAKPGQN